MLLEKQIQDLQFQMEEDMRAYETALNDRDVGINKMKEECKMMIVELQMLIDTKQVSFFRHKFDFKKRWRVWKSEKSCSSWYSCTATFRFH